MINHLMEKNINILSRRAFSISVFLLLFSCLALQGIETKRFDAPPPERPTYLSFGKPAPLRFSITPASVDRFSLIVSLGDKSSRSTASGSNAEANSTASKPFSPAASPRDANASIASEPIPPPPFLPQVVPPDILPLSDPFDAVDPFGADSTDELLRLIESSNVGGTSSSLNSAPFVPPYTIAPDGMRMTNKSSYRRIKR